MRSKEDAMDYRYFPEPDLPPLVITSDYINERAITSLPVDRRTVYLEEYKLQADDARILSEDRAVSDYYEGVVALSRDAKKSCSFITTVIFALFEEAGEKADFLTIGISAEQLARVITLVNSNELSSTNAKEVIRVLFNREGSSVDAIIEQKGLKQVNDSALLEKIAQEVIDGNPTQVSDYLAGKTALFGFFVGQCMKKSAGQGNPKLFTEILEKKLGLN